VEVVVGGGENKGKGSKHKSYCLAASEDEEEEEGHLLTRVLMVFPVELISHLVDHTHMEVLCYTWRFFCDRGGESKTIIS